MLVDWIKELLSALGLTESQYSTLTLFNFSVSIESVCLIIFVVWFIFLVVLIAKKFNKHLKLKRKE